MNKCDFCPDSKLIKGKLVCPYRVCLLPWDKIQIIMAHICKMEPETEPQRTARTIDESFMESLHANGRAVIKFGGASNE